MSTELSTETADIRLRKALMRLSRESSVAAVKAALALVHWDGVDVPSKVLEIIDDMDSEKAADNQIDRP